MSKKKLIPFLIVFIVFSGILLFSADKVQKKKELKIYDSLKWKSIRGSILSKDGRWLGYTLSPNLGISETIIKNTLNGKEYKFKVGKIKSYSGNTIKFNSNSSRVAFFKYPDKNKNKSKKNYKKLILLNLLTGKSKEYDKVKSFSFSKDNPWFLAILKAKDSDKKDKKKGKGSDLLIVNLKNSKIFNIGNVSEFSFNKKGNFLAYIIDADEMQGNGVYLKNMKSGIVKTLDSDKAKYKSLQWSKEKNFFTLLKGKESKGYKDKVYSILGFKFNKKSNAFKKYEIIPQKIKDFPKEMAISPHRTPYWSEVYNAIIFGIYEPEKKETKDNKQKSENPGKKIAKKDKKAKKDKDKKEEDNLIKELKLPSLIIWHYKDKRLQSMQKLQFSKDKNFSYLCIYNFKTKKFIQIANERIKNISISPKYRYAIGYDRTDYELEANLSGKRYSDIYSINLKTGEKKLLLKKIRWYFSPSYDGSSLLFYKDKNFYRLSLFNGKQYNLTSKIPTTFVNLDDDHNVKDPPVPQYGWGWSKDGKFVLLSDGWDVWKVDSFGKKFKNLTLDGKKNKIRYRYPFILDKNFKGFDSKKPVFISIFGELNKKSGIIRINLKNPQKRKILLWDDAYFSSLKKAEKANIYLFRKETFKDYPDFYLTKDAFKSFKKITDANPQQKNYLWSSGRILINYKNSSGKSLQGALFLPANYEKGKKYPTIVYIYEKLSWYLNRYMMPREFGFNPARYTSSGYAVLMPDIVYKVNSPGISSVDCITHAVRAAIKTGIVDEKNIGIHGHSWGGYQTAFIITQTNIFRAAVAGAPLTDLISMYSSIYWNTGSSNQPIFESSQGRFKGGYWDYLDDYRKNSPVFNATRVKTPLLLLHNNKDGAVDWNQGIEYYNTLRRLYKFVIMLEYQGENHGLRKKENRIDYGIRMKEFFDHFLKGKPAPAWIKKGIPYVKLKKYLKERKKIVEKN